jgi:hypothetical protein
MSAANPNPMEKSMVSVLNAVVVAVIQFLEGYRAEMWNVYVKNIIFACSVPMSTST